MNNISADKIKSLREKTGAGIMDCKNALVENNGDVEMSTDWLRKKGIAKANKKSSRVAAEGLVGISKSDKLSCLIEVNAETDFVSKNKDFQNFLDNLLKIAVKNTYTLDQFLSSSYDQNYNIKDALKNLIAKIGENIVIRRLAYLKIDSEISKVGFYIHNKVTDNLGKIGCMVVGENNDDIDTEDLLKKIAMHISASKPLALHEDNLDKKLLEKEKEIFAEQLANSGKPKEILDKIIDGKVKKFISEITLLKQNWILDPSKTVSQILLDFNDSNKSNFKIIDYKLFVLGEGVETVHKDFKEEVASQLADSQ